MQLVESEQAEAKALEVHRLVTLQRHARGDLQTLLHELPAVLNVGVIGVADHHARGLEPLCSVFVSADEVVVTADLPNIDPKNIKVEAAGEDLIEITAKMKKKLHFEDFGITHRQGEFSAFRCQTRIPVPVNIKKMKTQFKRGILEVHLPRKKGYRIRIE